MTLVVLLVRFEAMVSNVNPRYGDVSHYSWPLTAAGAYREVPFHGRMESYRHTGNLLCDTGRRKHPGLGYNPQYRLQAPDNGRPQRPRPEGY